MDISRSVTLMVKFLMDSAGRKKPEEELVSMNLGLGASLVLLLSKSAVELNKMVELRAQMEALVSEIRQAARWKAAAAEEEQKMQANHPAPAAPSTSQESDGRSAATTTAVKDPIAFPAADADADAASNCSRTAADTAVEVRAAVVMDLMEAELQAELSRMQHGGTVHGHGGADNRIAPMPGLEVRTCRTDYPPCLPRITGTPRTTRTNACVRLADDVSGVAATVANAESEDEERRRRR